MTSKERILRIFQNKEVDRPSLKLWGFSPRHRPLHPDYQPVHELAAQLTDVYSSWESPFNVFCGQYSDELITHRFEDTDDPTWKTEVISYKTPKGTLTERRHVSTVHEPRYTTEYPVKDSGDLEALLSMPYRPYPVQASSYQQKLDQMGECGVPMIYFHSPGDALYESIGSETIAYMAYDCRELLIEAARFYGRRVYDQVKALLDAGVNGVFYSFGVETFIPPLMSPKDYDELMSPVMKSIHDLIHDAGGYVWMHCHGKVMPFLDRFIEEGVDVLNPLEPAGKGGDVVLSDLVERYGNRIGLEGNIEIQDILLTSPDELKSLLRECVEAGSRSGRFILSQSAGFNEYPFPTAHYIENLKIYLTEGYRLVNSYAKNYH